MRPVWLVWLAVAKELSRLTPPSEATDVPAAENSDVVADAADTRSRGAGSRAVPSRLERSAEFTLSFGKGAPLCCSHFGGSIAARTTTGSSNVCPACDASQHVGFVAC